MLFRKKIEPRCAYCRHGAGLDHEEVICRHKGVVPEEYHCRRFVYDPLRRVPPQRAVLDLERVEEEDFSL